MSDSCQAHFLTSFCGKLIRNRSVGQKPFCSSAISLTAGLLCSQTLPRRAFDLIFLIRALVLPLLVATGALCFRSCLRSPRSPRDLNESLIELRARAPRKGLQLYFHCGLNSSPSKLRGVLCNSFISCMSGTTNRQLFTAVTRQQGLEESMPDSESSEAANSDMGMARIW